MMEDNAKDMRFRQSLYCTNSGRCECWWGPFLILLRSVTVDPSGYRATQPLKLVHPEKGRKGLEENALRSALIWKVWTAREVDGGMHGGAHRSSRGC